MKSIYTFGVLAACAALATLMSSQAEASIIYVTYVGVIGASSNDVDNSNIFSSASKPLVGSAFSLTFTVNTSNGTFISNVNSSNVYGGSQYNTSSPVMAMLSINGKSVSFLGPFRSQDSASLNPGYESDTIQNATNESNVNYITDISVETVGTGASISEIPPSILTPYSIDLASAVSGAEPDSFGMFKIFSDDYPAGSGRSYVFAEGELDPTHVNSSDVPPSVTEPTTWTMMLLGMGAVGSAVRRRQRTVKLHQGMPSSH